MSEQAVLRKVRRKRCNIEKQEAIVSALWLFARNQQRNLGMCGVVTSGDGTKVGQRYIRETLEKIMETFGYGVLEVQ